MYQEIERKFLVKGDFMPEVFEATDIKQCYLSRNDRCTVRVRTRGNEGYLTVKGKTNASHTARFEWEKKITKEEALALFQLAEPGMIHKTRHLVRNTDGKHIWEIDVFHGDNEGLIVAEIELTDENEAFDKPSWLGEEVTSDSRYFNSKLMKHPYKDWK